MPTYQYACTNPECGERFELVQSFTDPAASDCPVCGSPVRKVFSAVGVVFKGSGFYRNDSRAAHGKNAAKDRPGKESTSSGSSESTGSESKTSTTTDKKPSTGSTTPAAGKATASA
jgi:putative FmdB family regulatory protein